MAVEWTGAFMSCQLSRTQQGTFASTLEALTVGEIFYLKCHHTNSIDNPSFADISVEQIIIILKDHPWSQYVLKPLKVISSSDQDFLIQVTSYIPGSYNQGLFLHKDESLIELKGISWQVTSSLPQKASQKALQNTSQIQINPAYGFVKIPLPYLEMALWIGSLLIVLTAFIWIAQKMHKRKKEFNDIKNLKTLRSPIYEFHYKVKQIEKRYLDMPLTLASSDDMKVSLLSREAPPFDDPQQADVSTSKQAHQEDMHAFCVGLNELFCRFLAVEMYFPAHIWSLKKSLKHLKEMKLHTELLNRIQNMLCELDRSRQSKKELLSQEECRQNLSLSKALANEITSQKKKEKL